jgi:hypothetical protein
MLQRIGHDAVFPAEREFLASTRNALAYARNLAAGEATKPAVTASGA